MLGTDELNSYLNKYRLELDPHLEALVGRFVFSILDKSRGLFFKGYIVHLATPNECLTSVKLRPIREPNEEEWQNSL